MKDIPKIVSGEMPYSTMSAALTFDDGPAPLITRQVLDLLDKHSVQATFFVTGVNAGRSPEIIKEIIPRITARTIVGGLEGPNDFSRTGSSANKSQSNP